MKAAQDAGRFRQPPLPAVARLVPLIVLIIGLLVFGWREFQQHETEQRAQSAGRLLAHAALTTADLDGYAEAPGMDYPVDYPRSGDPLARYINRWQRTGDESQRVGLDMYAWRSASEARSFLDGYMANQVANVKSTAGVGGIQVQIDDLPAPSIGDSAQEKRFTETSPTWSQPLITVIVVFRRGSVVAAVLGDASVEHTVALAQLVDQRIAAQTK